MIFGNDHRDKTEHPGPFDRFTAPPSPTTPGPKPGPSTPSTAPRPHGQPESEPSPRSRTRP